MIFPLWRFWSYTPKAFFAAILWNSCELLKVQCPFAPYVFGIIMGAKGKLIK